MKITSQHPDLFLRIYLPFWIVVSAAYVFAAQWLYSGLSIQWAFVVLWLAALWTPAARLRVPEYEHPKRPLWRYVAECWAFQAALLCATMGLAQLTSHHTQAIHHHIITTFAVGPFFLFALIAGALATVTARGQNAQISSTITGWFDNTHLDSVGIMSDAYARSSSMVSMSMTVLVMMLAVLHLINQQVGIHFTTGVNVPMVLLLTALVCYPFSKQFGQLTRPLINYLPYLISLFLVCALCILAIYVLYFVGVKLEPATALRPNLFRHWNAQHYHTLLCFFFLLSWCTPYPGLMVHLAQGYRIRTLLLVSMSLPLGWAIWLTAGSPTPSLQHALPWLTLLSCSYLLLLFVRHQRVGYLTRAILPTDPNFKHRSAHAFIKGIMVFTFAMLGIYFFSDVYMLGYVPFIIIMPVAITMALGVRALFSQN